MNQYIRIFLVQETKWFCFGVNLDLNAKCEFILTTALNEILS